MKTLMIGRFLPEWVYLQYSSPHINDRSILRLGNKVIVLIGEYIAGRIPNEGAAIHLISPQDGDAVEAGGEVKVEIECHNFELGQCGNHWHLYVDGQSPRMIIGKSKQVILRDLKPGQYQIAAYLAVGSHTELEDGTTVTIMVK